MKQWVEKRRMLAAFLLAASALPSIAIAQETAARPADGLAEQFGNPPASSRPRVWWHWLNGNISEDGIVKDLEWMKSVGIGGVQAFEAFVPAPQIVEQRIPYMSPAWKRAFRTAAQKADELGLELAIAASPGFSETGGPWVPPRDAMKKVVWSETRIEGGKRFAGRLKVPPSVTGPFQSLHKAPDIALLMFGANAPAFPEVAPLYEDAMVLAVPEGLPPLRPERAFLSSGAEIPVDLLEGTDLQKGFEAPRGSGRNPSSVTVRFTKPTTIRSASFFVANAKMMHMDPSLAPAFEASDDGTQWRPVVDMHADEVPTTVSFAPVTARWFRLLLKPAAPSMLDLGEPALGVAMPGDASEFMKAMSAPWQVRQFALSGDAKVDSFETRAGFSTTLDYFTLPSRTDETLGIAPAKVINLTGCLRADGSLDWTPPRGRWRVLRFGYSLTGASNHPAAPADTGPEVDKMDGAAVRRYLEHYIGTYRDAAGSDLVGGRGVRALVTDSIEAGPSNWTPRIVEQFKQLRGYDPTPWLPTLAGVLIGDRSASDRFLFDWRRTLADLVASEHYGTVAKVAGESGLKVYGEALETRRPSLGDDMTMRSHADVPMGAMWIFGAKRQANPTYLADIRGAASVAHVYGQNVVGAESMTSAMNYWNDTPATLKRIIDLELVNGINLPVIHTSAHSPHDSKLPGLSMFYFGQFFNRHETWASMARPWVDYLARNSFLLQQGVNSADLAYFHGEEAPLTGFYGNKPVADAPVSHAYDFINADGVLNLLRNEGGDLVTKGGARYRALYLGGSSRYMSLAVLRRIARLAEDGATIIGKPPISDPGGSGMTDEYRQLVAKLWPGGDVVQIGKGRVIVSGDPETALSRAGVPAQFRFSGAADARIPFVHRKLPDGDAFFLVNQSGRAVTIDGRFRVTGKAAEIWRAETGAIEPASFTIGQGETVVPLSLAPEESLHVVFRRDSTVQTKQVARPTLVAAGSPSGPWTVNFQPGVGSPHAAKVHALTPLNEAADPLIRYFSGIATYSSSFASPLGWKPGEPLVLDLGEVGDLAEVRVNGKVAGSTWHAPYRVDISKVAQKGRNALEVRVANRWVNRLIGDAQPGAAKVTFTALPTYQAGAPLRRSGLIGPVVLLAGEKPDRSKPVASPNQIHD